jgi:hypothetical protein
MEEYFSIFCNIFLRLNAIYRKVFFKIFCDILNSLNFVFKEVTKYLFPFKIEILINSLSEDHNESQAGKTVLDITSKPLMSIGSLQSCL